MDLVATLGRFHPVVLHLPLGLLAGVVVLELASWRRPEAFGAARTLAAWLMALSAVVAVGTGLILQLEDGYGGDALDLHLWVGVAFGSCALLFAWWCFTRRGSAHGGRIMRAAMLVPVVGLGSVAGHFGGTLTHGEGFLFAHLSAPVTTPQTHFEAVIRPVLQRACYSCHGQDKDKGGLRLHTPDWITYGGHTGPSMYPGNAHESELVRRMRLPLEDDDHMPPKEKPQPTPDEIEAITAWINAGASFETLASLTTRIASGDDRGTTEVPASTPVAPTTVAAPPIPPLDDALLAPFAAAQVYVERLAGEREAILVDFAAAAGAGHADDGLATRLLGPVAKHAREVSLARTGVTDNVFKAIVLMPNLRRVNLAHTKVTSGGLGELAELTALEELNLVGTPVDDAGIEAIAKVQGLRRLHVWRSVMTPEGLARLAALRPDLAIDAGTDPGSTVLETEAEVKVSRFVAGATPAPAAAPAPPSLTPINTVCPVSGSPIDPRYAVVYEGRVIGFCCPNCPKSFWADPAAFLAKLPK